jgi:Amt family ammonium transporter
MAFATTHTASASAMLAWILFDVARNRRPSAMGTCIGAVVGLVAITTAAGYVTISHSIFIGAAASLVSNLAVHWKTKSNLDDTLDVFPCHGVGGIVGMLLTGVLACDVGLFAGETRTFLFHLLALAIVSVFSFFGSLALFRLTDWILPIRVTPEQEAVGLDLSQHGEFMELEPTRQFRYSE